MRQNSFLLNQIKIFSIYMTIFFLACTANAVEFQMEPANGSTGVSYNILFRLGYDSGSYVGPGWYVDDIIIEAP